MNRSDVALVTDRITGVTATGVTTATATYPADVIIFATGFETTQFLSSLVIRGRDGRTLQEHWTDRAGAYLGLSIPDFPNMFLMWGPNTNLGAGSIVYMMEAQADHVIGAVEIIANRPGATVEISTAAYREFLDEIREKQPRTIWAGCRNWYHDDRGNDIHNWHGSMRDYRRRVRTPHPLHYRVLAPANDPISTRSE